MLLEEIEGLEYSTDCSNWQSDGALCGFTAGEICNIYFRVNEGRHISLMKVSLSGLDEITAPDSTHLAWLKKNLLTKREYDNYAADFNGDGTVDIRDLVRLKRMLSDL